MQGATAIVVIELLLLVVVSVQVHRVDHVVQIDVVVVDRIHVL